MGAFLAEWKRSGDTHDDVLAEAEHLAGHEAKLDFSIAEHNPFCVSCPNEATCPAYLTRLVRIGIVAPPRTAMSRRRSAYLMTEPPGSRSANWNAG
jgi:hypothetical protein